MIANVKLEDGVTFRVKSISEIMDEAEYPGIRVSMDCLFDGTRVPLKIDISPGDIITPKEVLYSFKLMFEDRSIDVLAYNLETVIAEKLETVISRSTANTRMRDFYDMYILDLIYGNNLDKDILHSALMATAEKRGSSGLMSEAEHILETIHGSKYMIELWNNYSSKFSYASDVSWDMVITATRKIAECSGVCK